MTKNSLPFVVSALGLLFGACSSDDNSSQTEAFFNLNVGNKWAYKKYDSTVSPAVYAYTGIIDTVTVTGIQEIEGIPFSVLEHKTHNENNPGQGTTFYEYLRVDGNGHLVGISAPTPDSPDLDADSAGVLHPGMDSGYENTVTSQFGTIAYDVFSQQALSVEGNSYSVIPYRGFFTNVDPEMPGKTIEFDYEAQTGRVLSRCHAVASPYSWEERLVWYQLAD